MKKVVLLLVCMAFGLAVQAKTPLPLPSKPDAKIVDIIYVNGAYDDIESFEKSVRNVHGDMVNYLGSDPLFYKKVLENGDKKIGEKEVIYFWGDQSRENLNTVDKALEYAQKFSSYFAQFGRSTLAHLLHDAIWVNKPANSKKLLANLNKIVKSEHEKGRQVILYGYSAGSLVTFDYISKRLPLFDFKHLPEAAEKNNPDLTSLIVQNNIKPTCLEAMTRSEVLFYTDDDKMILNPNRDILKNNFSKLNNYTEVFCAPEGAIKGVVLFGTPLVTFESGATQQGSLINSLSQYLMKYIIEKDIFWLSVNYAQDFIGLPMAQKFDVSMLDSTPVLSATKPNGGFIYDNSNIKYCVNTLKGHSAYWLNGKKFAQSIVKTYNDGYEYFYKKQTH